MFAVRVEAVVTAQGRRSSCFNPLPREVVMRECCKWFAVAVMALGVGALTFAYADDPNAPAPAQPGQTGANANGQNMANLPPLALPNGVKSIDDPKVEDMKKTIAKATDAAVTKSGFDNLVD